MKSNVLWGIGILVYLAIGFGYTTSFRVIKRIAGEPLSKLDFILNILIWPMEFGALITRASVYYETRMNIYI